MSMSKTLKYSQNGTGRDSYIYSNNGGYYPAIQSVVRVDTGKYPKYSSRPQSANTWTRPKKYTTNGSGRDSYINSSSNSKPNFLKNLRSTTSSYSSVRNSRVKSTLDQQQKQFLSTWRLSQPKNRQIKDSYQQSQNYSSRQTTKSNFFKTLNPQMNTNTSWKRN